MNFMIVLEHQLGKFRVQSSQNSVHDNFAVGAKFKSIKQLEDSIDLEKHQAIHLTEQILDHSSGIYLLICGKCK